MNKELNIEIEEIISLSNGDPESILPGLFAPNSSSNEENPEETETPTAPELSLETSPSSSEPFDPFLPLRKKIKLNNYVHTSEHKYHGMQAQTLRSLIQGENVVRFCQAHNLIAKAVECHCGKQMRLQSLSTSDGCRWACYERKHNRAKMTVRKGTFFENSRLGIADLLWIAYMWVHEYSQISMLHECEMSNHTVTDWIQHFQDVCQAVIEFKNEPVGGKDKAVEIYDCKFQSYRDEKWAFFALEQYSTKSILIIVNDSTSRSIVEIFDKYFLPGTVVVSPVWCAMKNLTAKGFRYLTEEKIITFYDQVDKLKMKKYEDFKETTRRPPLKPNKWDNMGYGPVFVETMYRKSLSYAPDAYLAFLKDISMIYTPCTKCVKIKSEN